MHALGIDIGGSGIKAAPVDVTTGKLLADRQKIDTPHPALPDPVADVVKQLTTAFNWSGPVGITVPGVVEITYGAGKGEHGTVLMLTFGTGIGSALFIKGILVPNTEFGHIEIRGRDAESRASEHAKDLH